MNNPTSQSLHDLKEKILAKANIVMHYQSKPTVLLPVGSEWLNPDFATGLHMRQVESIRPNTETTAVKVDGLAGASMEEHYHDNREAIMCLKGRVRLNLPKSSVILQALDHFVVPIGAIHSLDFLEDSLLLVAWHPKFD